MDLQLKGKTVFISGSTAGIGFCIAKIFLQEGAAVYINGRTDASVLKAIQQLKTAIPEGKIGGVACDFSKADEVESLIKKLPKIDILINNVGIYTAQSFFETTDLDWNKQLDVNVMSGVRLSRHFLPKMLEENWGRILFVSSECATLIPADLIAYSTTKTAVLAISRGLAQLTKGTGVTVNSVIPGSTMTEGAEQFLADLAKKKNKTIPEVEAEFFTEARPNSLLQRFASVEEIANTIVYFSSPIAIATNGAAIKLDGGSMGGII
ncbi:MAG: NAD(P)-dependent dehydrogenase (short-subunit alcohol dehydrogenase family) [Saprospiraceae bacterium]|jgi:NAD(P)-dependent dehydrogenase (short-subunit alcohol dehydrogenase family)